ncbi:MAG: aldo/keto reductase [Thermoflexales bacterium]|nr:aldo/keto reductase [Thermoflexales bacterium]
MKLRPLGRSGLNVTPVCLGGNVFGWTIDEPTSFAILDAFVAGGGNFIDTADAYSTWVTGHMGGESETILGNWFAARHNRASVILATKVGNRMGDGGHGLSRAHILRSVEGSLRRLKTDYIDLYQSHIDDADTALEETLETYDALIKSGKVRAIGASNYNGARLGEALGVSKARHLARYECLQPLYNLVRRADYERDLEPVVLANNVGVIPYSSLASGFLTGKYARDGALPETARAGGVQTRYMGEEGAWKTLGRVEAVAKSRGVSAAQVALAWLIARPSVTAPIASATSLPQLKEILAAAALALTPAEIAQLQGA